MTTWKDNGDYGWLCREITDESGDRSICRVWTKQPIGEQGMDGFSIEPWPEGEANFRLILAAPQMLEALEMIQSAPAYEQYEEPFYALELTEDQFDQLSAIIAAAKGENDEISQRLHSVPG